MQKLTLSILAALAILTTGCAKKATNYISEDGFAQGSTFHIAYELPANATANAAANATANAASSAACPDSLSSAIRDSISSAIRDSIKLYFHRINKSVSGYDTTSILYRLNRGENPPLDEIFLDVFEYAQHIYKESNGAVDASAAPLFDLWGFGFKNGVEISKQNVDSLKQFIGMEKLCVYQDENNSKWYLKKADPRIMLNFNAIAQGYTADYFGRRFEAMGIENYLIEIGGEVYSKGVNPSGKQWRVGIDKPVDGNFIPGESMQAIIQLSGKGLVTSGNYRKFYVKDGMKYSHTVDPKTGYPVQHTLLSATVIADDATTADAYATYFMVVGLEKSKEILSGQENMEALLVYGEQENMKQYCTPGLAKMLRK